MKIECVKIMSKDEISSYFDFLKSSHIQKKEKGLNFIKANNDRIVSYYNELEEEAIFDRDERMRKRPYSNYPHKIRIHAQWLVEIKKKIKAPKYVTASMIYHCLMKNGCEDLRVKYGYDSTFKNSLSIYPAIKERGSNQEQRIANELSVFYPKVITQMGIKYKTLNQEPKRVFIDIVASDNNHVFLVEVKNSGFDIRKKQLQKYHLLVKHLMHNKEDKRNLVSLFCVFEKGKMYKGEIALPAWGDNPLTPEILCDYSMFKN